MTKFDDWLEACKKELSGQDELLFEIIKKFIEKRCNYSGFYGAVIDGITGSGKSFLATSLYEKCPFAKKSVDCARLFANSRMQAVENSIIDLLTVVNGEGPLILFLDNAESIFCNARRETSEVSISRDAIALERRVFLLSKSLIDKLNRESTRSVFLFALVRDRNDLPADILRPGRLNYHFYVNSSKSLQREALMRRFLQPWIFSSESEKEICIKVLSGQPTSGFTPADLESLLRMAFDLKMNSGHEDFELDDFLKARRQFTPSSIVARVSKIQTKNTNIIGLAPQLESISQYLSAIFRNDKSASLPRGILLEGPSGCGKSLIATQLSQISFRIGERDVSFPVNFISIDSTQVVSKYFGQSDRNLSQIFAEARRAAPCILFFDQIETLVGTRGASSDDSSSSDRLVTTFLVEMDGLKSKKDLETVIVLGTTNKKHLMDPAILRPGRFDLHVNVPLPGNMERFQFIESFMKRTVDEDGNNRYKLSENDISYLIEKTTDASFADLDSLFKEAAMDALREDINSTCVTIRNFKIN
jgi:transitional endoplasmic reticulum ATPase